MWLWHISLFLPLFPLEKMAAILADDIFKCIFLNENDRILIQISLKFVPNGPINNNQVLVYVMAWCRIRDKLLSEPMLTRWCAPRYMNASRASQARDQNFTVCAIHGMAKKYKRIVLIFMEHNCTNLQSLLNMQQVAYAMWRTRLKTSIGETF